jgi:hypothetical protein
MTNTFPWKLIHGNQLVTEHVSLHTSDQQAFPRVPIRYISGRTDQNEVRQIFRVEAGTNTSTVALRVLKRRKGNPVPGGITGPLRDKSLSRKITLTLRTKSVVQRHQNGASLKQSFIVNHCTFLCLLV